MPTPENPAKETEDKPMRGVLHFYSETGSEGGFWAFQDEKSIRKIPAQFVFEGCRIYDQVNPEREGKVLDGSVEVLKRGEWLPLPDPMQADPDYYESSLWMGEERGDREADKRLMERYDFTMKYALDRLKEDLDERFGEGNWSTEGTLPTITVVAGDETISYYTGGTPFSDRPYGVSSGELTRFDVEWRDGETEQRLSDSVLVIQHGYDGLKILDDGDELTVYDKVEPLKVVWQGLIKLRRHELFTQAAGGMWIHADMEGWDREEWAKLFFEEYPAELLQKNPE